MSWPAGGEATASGANTGSSMLPIGDTRRRSGARLSSQLPDHPDTLGPAAAEVFTGLGVPADQRTDRCAGCRPLLRFCLDWSEQRHHLAGRLGARMLTAFVDAAWITRTPGQRAVRITPAGQKALNTRLRLDQSGRLDL